MCGGMKHFQFGRMVITYTTVAWSVVAGFAGSSSVVRMFVIHSDTFTLGGFLSSKSCAQELELLKLL